MAHCNLSKLYGNALYMGVDYDWYLKKPKYQSSVQCPEAGAMKHILKKKKKRSSGLQIGLFKCCIYSFCLDVVT